MKKDTRQAELALHTFEQVISLDPTSADAHYYKRKVLNKLRRTAEAVQAYRKAQTLQS